MRIKKLNIRRSRLRLSQSSQPSVAAEQIARIDALTATGRANWIALLAFLAFVLVTTLGVEDIDFFVDSRQTELPLIGVSIPTFSFFVFAPILGSALYIHLHLYIRKVSEALSEPLPGNPPLEVRIKPWLLNDYVLRQRQDAAIRHRPLDHLADLATLVMVWWAGPLVLAMMWQRTWPAHVLPLSLVCASSLMIAVYAGVLSWTKMRADVSGKTTPRSTAATLAFLVACAAVVWLTVVNSKDLAAIGLSQHPRTSHVDTTQGERISIAIRNAVISLDRIDPPNLTAARISALPLDEVDIAAAVFQYRKRFCEQSEKSAAVCGPAFPTGPAPSSVVSARKGWCHEHSKEDCKIYFEDFEGDFSDAWTEYRTALIGEVPKPDLRGRDIRGAQLGRSALVGINLQNARLDEAFMHETNLEGADLSNASLENTFLLGAKLHRTDFGAAKMTGADLSSTIMHDTEFSWAVMTGAKLWNAQIAHTTFSAAKLRDASLTEASIRRSEFSGADLRNVSFLGSSIDSTLFRRANLSSANFTAARINASAFTRADLRSSNWTRATATASYMHGADLRGARGFEQRLASRLLGNPRTLLPADPDPKTGEPLYLLSCWTEKPDGWDFLLALVEANDWTTEAGLMEYFICEPGEPPRKTGTPWPLDMPPPWEKDPNWQPEDRGLVGTQPIDD